MSWTDRVKENAANLNARDFVAAGKDLADHYKFHAPGLGLELEGRDIVMQIIGDFVQHADVHYELEEVVEHDPFVVAFSRSTGAIDGQRMSWPLCEVLRVENGEFVEAWALRGAAPQPI